MIRHLTATGLTSTSTVLLHPNVGYRWKLLSALVFLATGTTTGDRSVVFSYSPYQSLNGYAMSLCSTGVQSGTGATYFGQVLGVTETSALYFDVYCDASANFVVTPSLQTGDTYGYDIQVLEEPDI